MVKDCIVITGGASGLGKTLTEKFRNKKNKVFVVDLKIDSDVRDANIIKKIVPKDYKIKLLINNAAVEHINWIEDTSIEEQENVISTNVIGYFRMVQGVLKHSMNIHGGTIINICSIAGKIPMRASCLYNVSKAAQIMMTKQMARELAIKNITVFGFNLGRMPETEMSLRIDKKILKVRKWDEKYTKKYELFNIPANRLTNTQEAADFIINIYEKATSYLTGSIIDFAGGQ